MKIYEIRTTELTVAPTDESLFSELATRVSIVDDAAGEYVEVSQDEGKVAIDPDEWVMLREAIDRMIDGCRKPLTDEEIKR